jgi:non-ribosomal peptide synthetase component F
VKAITLHELSLHPLEETNIGLTKLDLTLFIQDTVQGLRGWIEYNTDLFDATTIAQFVHYWQTLLENVMHDPTQHIGDCK